MPQARRTSVPCLLRNDSIASMDTKQMYGMQCVWSTALWGSKKEMPPVVLCCETCIFLRVRLASPSAHTCCFHMTHCCCQHPSPPPSCSCSSLKIREICMSHWSKEVYVSNSTSTGCVAGDPGMHAKEIRPYDAWHRGFHVFLSLHTHAKAHYSRTSA
jgi:hypothetical protein